MLLFNAAYVMSGVCCSYKERDGVTDELRVLLHNLLDAAFLYVLDLVVFQVQDHLGATPDGLSCSENIQKRFSSKSIRYKIRLLDQANC